MKLLELLSKAKPDSTVLQPFYWVMLILTFLLGICLSKEIAWWLLPPIIALLVIVFVGWLIAYFKCLNRNPDDLRSESYNIKKMEIENNISKSPE